MENAAEKYERILHSSKDTIINVGIFTMINDDLCFVYILTPLPPARFCYFENKITHIRDIIISSLFLKKCMMTFCSFHVAISFCIFADQTIPTLPFQMFSCRHREKGRKCSYLLLIQKIQPERETCHATEEFDWPWRPQGLFDDQVL